MVYRIGSEACVVVVLVSASGSFSAAFLVDFLLKTADALVEQSAGEEVKIYLLELSVGASFRVLAAALLPVYHSCRREVFACVAEYKMELVLGRMQMKEEGEPLQMILLHLSIIHDD